MGSATASGVWEILRGSVLHGAGGEVFLDHEGDLEDDGVIEFTQIQTGQLLDFLQAVHERITVYEQFTRSFGDIEVILEETLNGKERFVIE